MEDNCAQDVELSLDSLVQENKEEVLDEERLEKSLKEKQTEILKKLKDYRRKNGADILWFLFWCIVLGGDIYVKYKIWTEETIFRSIIYYVLAIISLLGIIYKLSDLSKNRKMKIDSRFDLSIIEDDIFLEEIKGLMPEIQDFVLWFLEGNKLGIEDELYWDMKRNLLDIIKDMAEALEKNDGVLLHDATAYGLSKYLELFLPEVEKE